MGCRKREKKSADCEQPLYDVISVDECKKIVADFELSDEKLLELRNYIIGIANSAMNIYLEDFR